MAEGSSEAAVRAFLIADVRGYTRYTQERGDEAAARLAAAFAELARGAVLSAGGEVIELRGDEALCVFGSARRAIRGAVELQMRFRRPTDDGATFPLPIGIGIDAGEALPVEGGFRGGALNTAARLCSLAGPGEILSTDTVANLARHVEGVRFVSRRPVRVKGLEQPVRLFEIVPEGLPPLPEVPTKRSPRLTKRRLVAAAILGAALIAGLVGLGVDRLSRQEFLDRLDGNAVGIIDADAAAISSQVMVGEGPAAIAAGGGFVWVASEADGTVSRIDAATRDVRTLVVGERPAGVAYGHGSVWVTNAEERSVAQIDPDRLKLVNTIPVGNGPGAVAAGEGAVWVANTVDETVSRIDVDGGGRTKTIPVGVNPSAIAVGGDAVWIAGEGGSSILRLDPRSGNVTQVVGVGNDPAGVAVDDGAVWVANRQDGTVSRLDPATNAVTATFPVGPSPVAVAAGLDAVWVANSGDGTIARIDPEADRVVRRISLESSPTAVALAAGSVWATGLPSANEHRGGVLKLELEPFADVGCGCIDPLTLLPGAVATLLYDGLFTYRRSPGISGSVLVANLAARVPRPADGGKTYTVELRRGIRFSDGAPLRASDVRYSIERLRRIPECDFCRRFDAITSIEADDDAGTVTFRLGSPDPDFAHALAVPSTSVVSAAASLQGPGGSTPGTGPYRVASYDPGKALRLVRNRHFRVWSQDVRPDGYPDEVLVRLRRDLEQSVAAVARGTADWVGLSFTARRAAAPERIEGLLTKHAGRLRTDPVGSTRWMYVNTRVPPFDDVRVRRALNYATDRRRVADLVGGMLSARPSCQLLPTYVPGHRPHCPYTIDPGPAGIWTAPDLAKAKALVAASGTRGMKVEIVSPLFLRPEPRIGRYFSSVLRRLGYRTTHRVLPDRGPFFWLDAFEPDRPQIGLSGVDPVPLNTASAYFDVFECESERTLRLCDRAIQPRVQRARRVQASDPVRARELWADLDREVVDRALIVPLTTDRSVALLSERVGNYRYHSTWGPLIEQMWVK